MAEAFAQPDVVIATSSPVAAMLREAGRTADAMIRCGLDHSAFYVTRDPGTRGAVVGFIARSGVTKRCGDAVTALSLLRKKYDIRVLAVGPGRVELPHWVEVIGAPSDAEMRAFYNELRVFLLPSDYEGWGLTAAEAMACGAAVVSTRNGGVEEFAEDGINALLVPTRDPGSIADACSRLLDDESSRIRIAESATRTARRMDWDESVDALEAILGSLSR
jgi:glycosyltransferase involved in cell wall biosynthesis